MTGGVYYYQSANRVKINLNFLGLMILFLIIIASAAYFLEINSIASLGYEMKAYENQVSALRKDNQKAKVFVAEVSSIKNMGDAAQAEKMQLVGMSDYRYLVIPSLSLASR